jgi:alkylation response protein AidB-like acyl-CoA dehydrogenase
MMDDATAMRPQLDRMAGLSAFRLAIRVWIEENAPAELSAVADWNAPQMGGATRSPGPAAKAHPAVAMWDRRLLDAGLICPTWPERYGGSDFTRLELAIFAEECFRASVPRLDRGHGETMVGPAILTHGSQEQKDHFLTRIIEGVDTYCQGFSEPNAGSDLASLQTKATLEDEELVVFGQKTWTSRANEATLLYCLCRTGTGARKHDGISFVLIPLEQNNVEIRPIRQITGATEFYETFLDGARAPMFNVIGGLDNGWHVAMTTLANERGGYRTMLRHLGLSKEFWELVEGIRATGTAVDPLVRVRLGRTFAELELIRLSGLQYAATVAAEREAGPEASVAKLMWSEYHRRFGELALDLQGASGLECEYADGDEGLTGRWADTFLASRAGTIYSGTSEIQRRIVAQRALGLPRGD